MLNLKTLSPQPEAMCSISTSAQLVRTIKEIFHLPYPLHQPCHKPIIILFSTICVL
jgi:hypothetical protein